MIWKLLLFAQIVDCHILSKKMINAPIAILPSMKVNQIYKHKEQLRQIDEDMAKCTYPKKIQDVDSKGNRYCMDCNWDL